MRCFLAEVDVRRFEQRAVWSACSEPAREGYFRLFNKNAQLTTFVRPLEQAKDRYGWFVEVVEPLDPYFAHVLQKED